MQKSFLLFFLYHFYVSLLKINSRHPFPIDASIALISLIFYLAFVSFMLLMANLLKFSIIIFLGNPVSYIIPFLIYLVFYLYFRKYRKVNCSNILSLYSFKSQRTIMSGIIIVWTTLLFSILIPILEGILS